MAIVYLMRGLPGSGKSTTARTLGGVVIEPDLYFFNDGVYRYSENQLGEARAWAWGLFFQAVETATSKIVLDRGNNADLVTQRFVKHAIDNGYVVELVEPGNAFWLFARDMLRNSTPAERRHLAEALSKRTMDSHRVSADVILARMNGWRVDLTVDDILNLQTSVKAS